MKEIDRYIVYTEGGFIKEESETLHLKKNYLNTDKRSEAVNHYNQLKKDGQDPYFEEKKVKVYVTKEKRKNENNG